VLASSPVQHGDVVRIRDQRWRVVSHVAYQADALLRVTGFGGDNEGIEAQFLLPCEHVEPLPSVHEPEVVRAARWRRIARLELADAVPRFDSLRTAARASINLIPFQLEPALAIVRGLASRILIADEVGLGKTIEAALVVAEVLARAAPGHALIVCPASLRDQWRHELETRFGLVAVTLDSSAVARAATSFMAGANPWTAAPVIVASIDYIKRPEVIRALESIVWDVVVLDEAHTLSGSSDRAHAADALARRARAVVMLSATPHSGDDAAFRRLATIGRLRTDPALLIFRRDRRSAGIPSSRRTHTLGVRTTREESELHQALLDYARLVWRQKDASSGVRLAMSVLLKRACSSASSLRRSLERRLMLLPQSIETAATQLLFDFASADDAEPLAELSAPGLGDLDEERRWLERLVALAHTASGHESKLRVLVRFLSRSPDAAIVFTEYRDTLEWITTALPRDETVQLHGGMTLAERREALALFAGGARRILLATDAASEGLNLHHRCRLVINMELPWTPLRLEQRVGRVDRIGQQRRVHAVNLIAAGTVEEKTVLRLLTRSARAAAALGAHSPSIHETEVARMVIDGSVSREARPGTLNKDIRAADLSDLASTEAGRLADARRLAGDEPLTSPRSRPVVAVLHRSPRRSPQECYWTFRGTFVDSSGAVLWSTLLAVRATVPWRPLQQPPAVRALLSPDRPLLRDAIIGAHETALASLSGALQPWIHLSLDREQDIADQLRQTRARLAALQPGLFDRRAERGNAAQSVVLDEALSQCTDRLGYLSRLRVPALGAHALMFAVALE
jgi:superfamily II DNA or RNA helicase